MLIGILALVGDSLDLWERTLGAGAWRDSVDVIYRTRGPDPPDRTVPVSPEPSSLADSPRWDDSVTRCRDSIFNRPPTLTEGRSASELIWGEFSPSDGDVGLDQKSHAALATGVWVHEDVIDIAPELFSIDEFSAMGAYHVGHLDVLVLLANRTDEELVITDISLDVERLPVPTGTAAHDLGGDPVELTVLDFDLNDSVPVAYGIDDDCNRGEPFFDTYVFEVAPRASEVVLVRLGPGDCLCLVRANIEFWHAGELQERVVPPADEAPFAVVAGGAGYEYEMVYVTSAGVTTDKHDCRQESSSELC
jgi:hypothetical protein